MKKISIMMSTYNGEKFLGEQIESILNQQDVETSLFIRDDGSTDGTIAIIEFFQTKYPQRICLFKGKNVGYRKSFLKLLEVVGDAEFYGFADQDDVWMSQKSINAIQCIERENALLYASGVILTDGELHVIGRQDISNMSNSIESYFSRSRLAGCTFVFPEQLKRIVEQFSNLDFDDATMPDHDFVVGSCAFACGKVFLDNNSYIYHRRHKTSVTNGGMGISKRIRSEYKYVFHRKNIKLEMAKMLLEKCEMHLREENKGFLQSVVEYKISFTKRLKLFSNPKLTSNMFICDLEQRIKIILSNY